MNTAVIDEQPVTPAPGEARVPRSAHLKAFLVRNSMVVIVLLSALYFYSENARFGTTANLQTILIAAAPFALIAFGQTLVILTGGIDLSVGSTIALSAMSASWMIMDNGSSAATAVAVALVVGLAVGSVNGLLVAMLNVPPFVATLATLTAASGLAYAVGDGAPITGLPSSYGDLANTKWLGFQLPVWFAIAGFVVLTIIIRRTTYGTRIYAVGGNRVAAQIAGINVRSVLFSVYAISGLLAGLSGVLLSSRVQSGAPTLGSGYELDAIAAVVIGGASLMGGRGTMWGTAVGLLLIQMLNNGLDILLVPSYWQDVIVGALIAMAVAIDVFVTRKLP
ncbi:ABC transporter permease [Nocardioides sp. SYSU D00065]|uniref:ABC transporter permease n=1 Tax=Nocardioides sp. SYSU D00065 TaxID=2817378 RepID=UPI001B328BB8|nr:ABC transporter permease [Nocardioides sp. SYSU D00065]